MRIWPQSEPKKLKKETTKLSNGHDTEEDEEDFIEPEDEVVALKEKLERLETLLQERDKEIERLRKIVDKNADWTQTLVMELVKTKEAPKPLTKMEEYLARKNTTSGPKGKLP